MLSIFRKNSFIYSLLLIPYCFVLRIHSFIFPQTYSLRESDGLLNYSFFSFINNHPVLESVITALILSFLALMLVKLTNKNRLARGLGSLAGVSFLLFTSVFVEYLILSPYILGLPFVIIALQNIFRTYKKSRASLEIFNTGFFTALSSLFYLPFATLILASFFGFITIRSFSFKQKLQFVFGAIIPYYLLYVYQYVSASPFNIIDTTYQNIMSFDKARIISLFELKFVLFYGFFFVFCLLSHREYVMKKGIDVQKKINILYLYLFLPLISFLFWENIQLYHWMIYSVPLAIFLSINISQFKNKFIAEILHIIVFISIIIGQFSDTFLN